MFGAYEAGVWRALSRYWTPDLIVGASIGAVNGWVAASLCDPEQLVAEWMQLEKGQRHRLRFPWPPLDGVIDCSDLDAFLQRLEDRYQPRIDFALTATRFNGLRPRLFRSPGITWRHLAASCALPFLLRAHPIAGHLYVDGGLKGAVPVWAALECGATHIVAVNILPRNTWLKPVQAALRLIGSPPGPRAVPVPLLTIEHDLPLGPLMDSAYWNRTRIERWVQLGQQDAVAARERVERLLLATPAGRF